MNKVVMIDQDGVVCNEQYQVTADIHAEISAALSAGLILVPNSDTPVKRLLSNFERMLGFVANQAIAENGAVVYDRGKSYFTANIRGVEQYREKLCEVFRREGLRVVIGDSATMVKDRWKFAAEQQLAIVDEYRQQSVGFYLRCTDADGNMYIDQTLMKRLSPLINQITLPSGLTSLHYNAIYAIAISNAVGINKTNGVKALLPLFSENTRYFQIGDGAADIINIPQVEHCAVGNAVDALKEVSVFTAQHNYTAGLAECLAWIRKIK